MTDKINKKRTKDLFHNENKIEQGWLDFFVENKMRWERVHCHLQDKKFKFYKDPECRKLEGVLDFDFLTVHISLDVENAEFDISILASSKKFHFRAESPERLK